MSSAEHEPTHLPEADCQLQPVGYAIGVQFHEPLKLIPQKGLEFAAKLADYVDPRGVVVKDDAWVFTQPLGDSAAGFLQAVVRPAIVTLDAQFPTSSLEWLETRYTAILSQFRKTFHPTWLPASSAKVCGTLQIDGDARAFLCEHLTKMSDRLGPLDRPLHLFGIRIALPAFELLGPPSKGKKRPGKVIKSSDWSVEVKVESFFPDPTKLYLEATGQWQDQTPKSWSEAAIADAVGHLAIVSQYMKEHLIPFLTTEPGSGGI
jgi:hypothetical protein